MRGLSVFINYNPIILYMQLHEICMVKIKLSTYSGEAMKGQGGPVKLKLTKKEESLVQKKAGVEKDTCTVLRRGE